MRSSCAAHQCYMRRVRYSPRLAQAKPIETVSVSCQPCCLHDCHHAPRIRVICAGCCTHQGMLRQGLFDTPVCYASPAGLVMRCASVVYAQGAECTKGRVGNPLPFLAFGGSRQPCWQHDCRLALRISVICAGCRMHQDLLRQSLLTPSVWHTSPAGCMIVITRCASGLYAQGAARTKACFGKPFSNSSVCHASPAGRMTSCVAHLWFMRRVLNAPRLASAKPFDTQRAMPAMLAA